MTNTEVNRETRVDREANGSDEAKLLTTTEARRSTTTSELWLTVASFAAIVIAGYFSDALSVDRSWLFATIVMAAYVLSRGVAKDGSSDTTIRKVDLRRG